MKKVFPVIFLLMGFIHNTLLGQSIRLGDQFPNITFDTIIGQESTCYTIPNDEGKLLVLDFWSTVCSSCIIGISKLDSIESILQWKIQVIPIIDQEMSAKDIMQFWTKNRILNESGRWTLKDHQKIVQNLIPRNGVPFYVFIDKNGKYRGSGGHEYFRIEVLNRLLTDSTFNIGVNSPKKFFQVGQRLFLDDETWNNLNQETGWYKFGSFKEDLYPGIFDVRVTNKSQRIIQFVNLTIKDMYKYCFSLLGFKIDNIKVNIPDSLSEYNSSQLLLFKKDWDSKNRFTAEIRFRWHDNDELVAKQILKILDLEFNLVTDLKRKRVDKKRPVEKRRAQPSNPN